MYIVIKKSPDEPRSDVIAVYRMKEDAVSAVSEFRDGSVYDILERGSFGLFSIRADARECIVPITDRRDYDGTEHRNFHAPYDTNDVSAAKSWTDAYRHGGIDTIGVLTTKTVDLI